MALQMGGSYYQVLWIIEYSATVDVVVPQGNALSSSIRVVAWVDGQNANGGVSPLFAYCDHASPWILQVKTSVYSFQCIFCPIGYCNDARFLVLFIQMNKEEIGAAIVERRGTLDITQARLAKLSGVSVHTLSNLETGKGNVTLDTLLKVAGIVGYKVRVGV